MIEWIFLISGGCTFAYMLKLFICIFIEKHPQKQHIYDASRHCMNGLTSATLLISSLLMPLLGVPALSLRLAGIMTGGHGMAHFHAFAAVNLKGGAISLGIGAVIYLFFVRKVLIADGRYVNRWPARLDLEDAVYRPLLLRILPGIGGFIARLIALLPDGIMIFMRSTVLRERKRLPEEVSPGRLRTLRKKEEQAAMPVVINFSFAIMMTCLGMLIVFGVILFVSLR